MDCYETPGMAPKKLTEADKTAILGLYRQPQETTSTLAERYGVSNSTISRLLKASLPEAEYSVLIQQKRGMIDRAVAIDFAVTDSVAIDPAPPQTEPPKPEIVALTAAPAKAKPRGRRKNAAEPAIAPIATAPPAIPPEEASPEEASLEAAEPVDPKPAKPTRRRSRAAEPEPLADPQPEAEPTQLSLPDSEPAATPTKPARPVLKSMQPTPAEALETDDLEDDWDDPVLGDDYDEDDDDGDDEDGGYPWEIGDSPEQRLRQGGAASALETLEIAPLTADVLPPLCYVVVERTSSELVVLPLRTFADLGQIPEEEEEARTLPVFENHNVARRFSRRNQRVVKVPDGSLLQTTSPYLQAKGITRLFIDGQVFSLDDGAAPSAPVAGG
jgi:hypothetical protein